MLFLRVLSFGKDPAHTRDPSGCTAVAALITSDDKIFVVSPWNDLKSSFLNRPQANAGDSRSVLSVMGEAKPLSFDHKPMNDCKCLWIRFIPVLLFAAERSRIMGAGGYVECGRVNGMWIPMQVLFYDIICFPGNLALSRALGDFEFKKNYNLGPEAQIITSNPEVTCHEITKEDEFLIIACDGVSPFIFHTHFL